MSERADGRRTDTRERIRATALEMFTTQGYERTTLAEVADRLAITRPAVYHHFRSKEDVLASSYGEVLPELAELAESLQPEPAPWHRRSEALDRFAALLRGKHGALLVCARVNEHALAGRPAAAELLHHLDALTRALAPATDIDGRMRARLALSALVMAEARGAQLGGTAEQRATAALALARELLNRK
ncbi:helix-turn-helix domain-containing protein [Amycolatopsis sp. NPDC051102]|uniref:TetR/AcrR family transcriptional regulator n=1 Tax=Amycolatopsis sp. NPDC051102 TaxID=3155163 RepID=UPI00342CA984